ncbi:MAG: pyridoxamine 5'-phosphate oxidase family protein [Desulfonatronovibrio sp.]
MDLKEYFDNQEGLGILSTANAHGEVNAAVYSRPHIMDDGSLAFIMNNRLSYANLKENPKAHYLFKEKGSGYKGKRLTLTRIKEEEDSELLYELCRRCHIKDNDSEHSKRYLVYFKVDKELPLIGSGA